MAEVKQHKTPPKVLLAEDNDDIRRLLVSLITALGYQVIEARDGEEAWCLLQECPPDLIVTDINMPKKSGIDLIKMVRRGRHSPVPIMVMSAYDSGHLRDAIKAGADIPLRKPDELDRLIEMIDEVLKSKARRGAGH